MIQEAYAQLEVKRASRRMLGTIRAVCWTDHANLTRAQSSDIGVDMKLVRWIAEILADGSEIRSISGRAAKLGDGFSRNPKDRDRLIAERTKDIEGLTSQMRGFDLQEFLGEGTEGEGAVAWAVGDDAVPDPQKKGSASTEPSGSSPPAVPESRGAVVDVSVALAISEVRVMVLMDYQRWTEGSRSFGTRSACSKTHSRASRSSSGRAMGLLKTMKGMPLSLTAPWGA